MNIQSRPLLPSLVVVFLALLASMPAAAEPSNRVADVIKTSRGDLRLMPIYHGSVMLEFNGRVIHVDPWSRGDYTGLPQADLIVITHTHADHLDREMITKLKKPSTMMVMSPAGTDTLNCNCPGIETIANGGTKTVMGIEIEAVPMYNLVQGPEPGKVFHHKGVGNGYVLGFGDTRVYFSGDTECVPEMRALKNIAVAFVAMNPPRTMSAAQAGECVKAFRPTVAYPYHYRGQKPEDFAAIVRPAGVDARVRKLEGEE